jgi:hypothetical protein
MKVVEQGRHGGVQMRVCPVTAVLPVTLGQADVLVLVFTCVRDCESAFRDGFFWVGFWHVLPVPSFIAVCLSGGVLAWGWPRTKREDLRGEGFRFWWPPFRVLFANCAQSIFEP